MRFNFLGGPGAGKSTTAPNVFADMKRNKLSVELAREMIKPAAYRRDKIELYDQISIMGQQMNEEYQYIKCGVKNIVTDSPLLLSLVYAPPKFFEPIRQIVAMYDWDYPTFNIFLNRNDKEYIQDGRWQTEEEARKLDQVIFDIAKNHAVGPVVSIDFQNYPKIIETVLENATR
jgi:adenylate kinase family enzyme